MKLVLLLAAFSLVLQLHAGMWDDFSARPDKNKRNTALYSGKKQVGWLRDFQRSGLVELSAPDGMLHVDTTRYRQAFPGKPLDIFHLLTPYPNETVVLEVELAGQDGKTVDLYFDGQADKHFWRRQSVVLTGEPTLHRFETKFPANLKNVAFRISFADIPLLKVGQISYTRKSDDVKVDARANHIFNGGAERGFYNLYPPSAVRVAEPVMPVSIDAGEFHSGAHSFRLDPVPVGSSRLMFNAVPYLVGKPIVFSMFMKAEKPGTQVNIGLFSAHGAAYEKIVKVGTQWGKYELRIPAFGERAPGVTCYGDPAMTAGFAHTTPMVTPRGRIWLDDVSCQLADQSTDLPPPAIAISGKLDTRHGYLYQHETLRGTLKCQSATAPKCTVTWELRNWRGDKILSGELAPAMTMPVEKSFDITPPAGLLGPLNLTFTAENDKGERFSHTFYTGILRAPGKSSRRWGTNVHAAPADHTVTVRLFRDFGIGAVRLWAKAAPKHRGGFHSAALFHDAGFWVMMNIAGNQPGSAFHISRDSRAIIETYFKDEIIRNRGKVDLYELFNEPEIWAGRTANPDPAKYTVANAETCAAATVQMAQAIRKLDPDAKIAGPGCHLKPEFLEAYLKAGAAPVLDYLTEHPYRQLPEMPDLETAQEEFQAVLKKYRPDCKILSSESGNVNFPTFPDNRIPPVSLKLAARDLRYALLEFACGVGTYFHFQSAGIDLGYAWTGVLGDPDHDWVPGLFLYAVRNAVDLLGDAPVARRVRIGGSKRCYIYDRGDRRMAVLWQWSGAPETLIFAKPARFYDMMGNSFTADRVKLDDYPVYLESELPTAELDQFISSAKQIGIEKPLTHAVELCGADAFGIRLNNITRQTLTGFVECAGARKTFKLYGEKSELLTFRAPAPISPVPQTMPMKLHIDGFRDTAHTLRLCGINVPRAKEEIRIDGDLSDWPASSATEALVSCQHSIFRKTETLAQSCRATATPSDAGIEQRRCHAAECASVRPPCGCVPAAPTSSPSGTLGSPLPSSLTATNRNPPEKQSCGKLSVDTTLDYRNARCRTPWTDTEKKIRGEIRFAWNDANFFIAVTVEKENFQPEEKFGKNAIWRGDSLQLGIDTMKNATEATVGLESDDFEYLLGEFHKRPLVWRMKSSSASWDSFGKATGEVEDVKLAIRHLPGKTVYEMAFSPIAVSPFRLIPNAGCRLTLLLNLSNGKERIGWLQLAPGMGDMPQRPGRFMDIRLQP